MRIPGLALGALLFAGSLLLYPTLVDIFTRAPFAVHLVADDVSESGRLAFEADTTLPLLVDGEPFASDARPGSGLHHLRWSKRYGGGHQRSVGHTQLVGPLQDPSNPPCSTHLIVGQAFLDDGKASEGTMAHVVSAMIEAEFSDVALWPLGRFRGIEALHLNWSRLEDSRMMQRGLRALTDQTESQDELSGYLQVSVDLRFDKAVVPLRLSLIPRITQGKLGFKLLVYAKLQLDNRFYQMIVNLFDGNDRVSRIIEQELSAGLLYVLDSPPSIPLGNGSQLDLAFCEGHQLIFHERGFVAVPLAIKLDDRAPAPPLEDIASGPVDESLQAALALDIDRNGLNAIAHKLWSSGLLDQEVGAGLARDFNAQESVRDFLSLRIESARFHLPPTIELLESGLRLRAAMRAQLSDGDKHTQAQLFTQIAWPLESWQPGSPLLLRLDEVQMTCSDGPRLQACYTQILEQVRANQEVLQSRLAQAFSTLLTELLIRRDIGDDTVPASFELERTRLVRHGAVLRGELFGQLSKIKQQ